MATLKDKYFEETGASVSINFVSENDNRDWYYPEIVFNSKTFGETNLETTSLDKHEIPYIIENLHKLISNEISEFSFVSLEDTLHIQIKETTFETYSVIVWRDLHEYGERYIGHGESFLGLKYRTSKELLLHFYNEFNEEYLKRKTKEKKSWWRK